MEQEGAEVYRDFIEKLQREEHRPGALNSLKNFLTHKPAGEAVTAITEAGLSKILKCLTYQDKTQVDLTCEVLRMCFEKFSAGDIVRNYTGHTMFLLRHESDCVRKLAVDEVYRTVTTNQNLLPIPQFINIFVAVAQLVADQDIGISNKAILITSHLPLEAYPKILDEMKIALEYSHSSKCNAFEVIINISSRSPDLLNLSAEHGYISFMLSELKSNDVLYQMNILELLARFAITAHGIKHLVEQGALQNISDLVVELDNNPLGSLLIPGYMKFFGSVAHLYPREIFEKYPALLESLFAVFRGGDLTVLPVALDTLGFIGASVEGKLSLAGLGSKYTQTVECVCQLIRNSVTEIKIRALLCMASLIDYEKDLNASKSGQLDHRVTLMTREWFRMLSKHPEAMESLFGFCKNPFPDIRLAAFSLLASACQHRWAHELVAQTAGFIEYLLDRSVDHTKESKEAKYDVVKRLAGSASFDAGTIIKMTTYVEQGPFYSEAALEVAMEEGD